MTVYSYLVEHDLGLAPNPFGKYCTLAVCKPDIRKSRKLAIGDWVIGTGSKALATTSGKKVSGKLIYAMAVDEKIRLEDYWNDDRFQYKKPIMNGTLVTMFGDNFYHKDQEGKWIQDDSAHCKLDGSCNPEHFKKDVGGANALISEHFFYFGSEAPQIPKQFMQVCHSTQGQKKIPSPLAIEFINWIHINFRPGIHGDPLNWREYNQLNLF